MRAPASNLAALGAPMLAGLVLPRWTRSAMVLALTVFVAFGHGRHVRTRPHDGPIGSSG